MDSLIKPPGNLLISRSELHVWHINLDSTHYPYKKLISTLSSEELRKAECFIFYRDRYRYHITHSLKRLILSYYLACDPKWLDFKSEKKGKPRLDKIKNSLNLQFNITHSHKIILIAVTIQDSIGIDIEYHDPKKSIENLCKNILSPLEEKYFIDLNKNKKEEEKFFFRCWTRKEAFLKAIGIGLAVDLTNISVDMSEFPLCTEVKILKFKNKKIYACKFIPLYVGDLYTAVAAATPFQKKLFNYNTNYLFY